MYMTVYMDLRVEEQASFIDSKSMQNISVKILKLIKFRKILLFFFIEKFISHSYMTV